MQELVLPTPERFKQGKLLQTEAGRIYNPNPIPSDRLYGLGIIDDTQRDECARFFDLYHRAKPPGYRSCLNIREGGRSTPDAFAINAIGAADEYAAVVELISPACLQWLLHIVIDGRSLNMTAALLRKRKSSAKELFLEAVSALHDALKFVREEGI